MKNLEEEIIKQIEAIDNIILKLETFNCPKTKKVKVRIYLKTTSGVKYPLIFPIKYSSDSNAVYNKLTDLYPEYFI